VIDEYLNLDLRLFGCESSAEGMRFMVQVEHSPVGEQRTPEAVIISRQMQALLQDLELRRLDQSAMVDLGSQIGELLFPPSARWYFTSSISKLFGNQEINQGLRIRIKCSAVELERIPWEFAYLSRDSQDAGRALGMRGFLVCDTRISMVRYELHSQLMTPVQRNQSGGRRRLVALLCDPEDRRGSSAPLNIAEELSNLHGALTDASGFDFAHCDPPTRDVLQKLLYEGADVFHFAGHGEFRAAEADGVSTAYLVLQRDDGSSDEWMVDDLARRLAGKGIQLAVLGACRSAQTDGLNSWAGIAPSLIRAGIPLVIGMQYTVCDVSAIRFSKVLYEAWSKLKTIDEAVAEARSAILDLPEATGRDFATPVLYYRSGGTFGRGVSSDAAPATQHARDPKSDAILQSELVNALLYKIAKLYDYKQFHEALHSARTRALNLVEIRRRKFPGDTTVREFAMYGRELRRASQDVRRIQCNGLCEPMLMQEVSQEFDAALVTFENALTLKDADKLDDALASFDSLLGTVPSKIDASMAMIAGEVDLRALAAALHDMSRAGTISADQAAAVSRAATEIRDMQEQFRCKARIHHLCQRFDAKLALIRKMAKELRFKAMQKHWTPMSQSISEILVDWNPLAGETLKLHSDLLGQGIAANDKDAARLAFDQVCDDFDYGFLTVDTDFKDFCRQVNATANHTVASLRNGGRAVQH
jgi:hypothetical protein